MESLIDLPRLLFPGGKVRLYNLNLRSALLKFSAE
jgi:hypothetical protein